MAELTIRYHDQDIINASTNIITSLLTSGKYLDDDIDVILDNNVRVWAMRNSADTVSGYKTIVPANNWLMSHRADSNLLIIVISSGDISGIPSTGSRLIMAMGANYNIYYSHSGASSAPRHQVNYSIAQDASPSVATPNNLLTDGTSTIRGAMYITPNGELQYLQYSTALINQYNYKVIAILT